MTEQEYKKDILEKIRARGYRVTKQREMLLDMILSEEWSCCKEIYYKAQERISDIEIEKVYRMINVLEELGIMEKKRILAQIQEEGEKQNRKYRVILEEGKVFEVSEETLQRLFQRFNDKIYHQKEK